MADRNDTLNGTDVFTVEERNRWKADGRRHRLARYYGLVAGALCGVGVGAAFVLAGFDIGTAVDWAVIGGYSAGAAAYTARVMAHGRLAPG